MPIEQFPVQFFKIDYKCDVCGVGHYRNDGIMLTSNPPQYPHECNNCGGKKTFLQRYPRVVYKRVDVSAAPG